MESNGKSYVIVKPSLMDLSYSIVIRPQAITRETGTRAYVSNVFFDRLLYQSVILHHSLSEIKFNAACFRVHICT